MPPEQIAQSQAQILLLLKDVQENLRENQLEMSGVLNQLSRHDKLFDNQQAEIDRLRQLVTDTSMAVVRLESELKAFAGRFDCIDERQEKVSEKVFALDKKLAMYLSVLTAIVMGVEKGWLERLLKLLMAS